MKLSWPWLLASAALVVGCASADRPRTPTPPSVPDASPPVAERPVFAPVDPLPASPSPTGEADPWVAKNCVEGVPRVLDHATADAVVIHRRGYVLAHSASARVPLFVSEGISREQLEGPARRRDNFRPDPSLPPGQRAELVDYRGSGFDRGHMAPAGDMKQDQELMDESFFLSNIIPQVGVGFNRDLWASLEEWARTVVRSRGQAYIITGPLFLSVTPSTIGPNRVTVPSHCYKIVATRDGEGHLQAIAFVMENRAHTSDEPQGLERFIQSIDWIEERVRIDFMPDLSPAEEERLERAPSPMWN